FFFVEPFDGDKDQKKEKRSKKETGTDLNENDNDNENENENDNKENEDDNKENEDDNKENVENTNEAQSIQELLDKGKKNDLDHSNWAYVEEEMVQELHDFDVKQKDYVFITVKTTFQQLVQWLIQTNNYQRWNCSKIFAIERRHVVERNIEKLGYLNWKPLYPRQCLMFAGLVMSLTMILLAFMQVG
ncbi:hypothetical protein RFI_15002, partial [Reticulomyxa filosa]